MAKNQLAVTEILTWADAHRARTGFWPRSNSGRISEAPGDNWANVDTALRAGVRGLPGGDSLSLLLYTQRGVPRYSRNIGPLDVEQILSWADAYHARTGS